MCFAPFCSDRGLTFTADALSEIAIIDGGGGFESSSIRVLIPPSDMVTVPGSRSSRRVCSLPVDMVSSIWSRGGWDGATGFNITLVSGPSQACSLAFSEENRDACRGSQCLITFDDAGTIDMARTTPSKKAIVDIESRMQKRLSKQETERMGFWRVYNGLVFWILVKIHILRIAHSSDRCKD